MSNTNNFTKFKNISKDVELEQVQTIISNNSKKEETITSFFELQQICNEITNLQNQIKTVDKIERNRLQEKINALKSKLSTGMPMDCSLVKDEIENQIIVFLEKYGYKKEFILEKLKDVKFKVTNEKLNSGGFMSAVGNNISIDYSVIDFDKNGNIIGFKQEKQNFIRYVLTHELLHICSNPNNVSLKDDALSEGFTDMFAHIISKNYIDKSENYDFLVKICTLFTNMLGMEKILDDYINNLDKTPNLRSLFQDEYIFMDFYHELNNILELQMNKKEVQIKKIDLLYKLKDIVFLPFLEKQQNKEEFINLFNNIFKEYGVSYSKEKIIENQNIR